MILCKFRFWLRMLSMVMFLSIVIVHVLLLISLRLGIRLISLRFWLRFMIVDWFWLWLMMVDRLWFWLMMVDRLWFWLMMVDRFWFWVMMVNRLWLWLMMMMDRFWFWLRGKVRRKSSCRYRSSMLLLSRCVSSGVSIRLLPDKLLTLQGIRNNLEHQSSTFQVSSGEC